MRRNVRGILALWFSLSLWCVWGAGVAHAETHRIAILVGNNAGSKDHPVLRFAQTDAGKVGRVLNELGGIAEPDLLLLQGRSLAELKRAAEVAKARTAEWHAQPDTRVLFLFYFSGHSDGQSLEVGQERLSFDELRAWISNLGADVRLVIVDSCRSGSLLRSKGGVRISPFEIRLTDDLPNSGEAVMTSSAANESALESDEIRGSFFTHYLVSGLRGAADSSGDGQVSLAEAYEYAFAHTISATARTLAGTQHPSYDYRLSGQGELVLTELYNNSAGLIVPAGYERILVTHLLRDQVVAELTAGARVRLALRPGAYGLRAWKGKRQLAARIDLVEEKDREVLSDELVGTETTHVTAKGDASGEIVQTHKSESPGRLGVFVAIGQTTGVAHDLGAVPAARVGLRSSLPSGFELNLDGARGVGPGFTESRAVLLLGYRAGLARGRFSAFVGAEVGGGLVAQSTATGNTAETPCAVVSPSLGGLWWASRHVALNLEGHILASVYQRDSHGTASLWPVAYLGVTVLP